MGVIIAFHSLLSTSPIQHLNRNLWKTLQDYHIIKHNVCQWPSFIKLDAGQTSSDDDDDVLECQVTLANIHYWARYSLAQPHILTTPLYLNSAQFKN